MEASQFWNRADRYRDCWIWKTSKRYGGVKVDGKFRSAHRFAWELENGPIPDGLFVCHHCDNPRCIRPDHLFLGTNRDNILDAVRKGRKGKLSPAQVREIRNRFDGPSPPSKAEIAREFGVCRATILNVVTGHTFAVIA